MKMREEDPEVKEPPKQEEHSEKREKLTHEEIIREVLGRC